MDTKEKIERSLLSQLRNKGALNAVSEDLVKDYAKFYDAKEMCLADITERGTICKSYNSQGLEIMKENPSVKEALTASAHMLKILATLNVGLDPDTEGEDDDLV